MKQEKRGRHSLDAQNIKRTLEAVNNGARSVKEVAFVLGISNSHAQRLLVKSGCEKVWTTEKERLMINPKKKHTVTLCKFGAAEFWEEEATYLEDALIKSHGEIEGLRIMREEISSDNRGGDHPHAIMCNPDYLDVIKEAYKQATPLEGDIISP